MCGERPGAFPTGSYETSKSVRFGAYRHFLTAGCVGLQMNRTVEAV